MCLNGTPLGSVNNLPSCHRSPNSNIWEAPGLLSDGDTSTEINMQEDTVWMEQLEEDVMRPMR